MSKPLIFINAQDTTWTPYFPSAPGGEDMLKSMEPVIEATNHDTALKALQERYGKRLLQHELLMAEKGGEEVPAIMVEIKS